MTKPTEIFKAVNGGRTPHLLLDIHDESEVNQPQLHLGKIQGPAHGDTFNNKIENA